MKKLTCLLTASFAVVASSCGSRSCEIDGSLSVTAYQENLHRAYEIAVSPSGEVSVSLFNNFLLNGQIKQNQNRKGYKKQISAAKFTELHDLMHELDVLQIRHDSPQACRHLHEAYLVIYHSPTDADPEEPPGSVLFVDCPGEGEPARKLAAAFVTAAGAEKDVEEWPIKEWR